MKKASATDPIKVAYALEGMKFAGPSGESWMRAEDHQMISPIYILSFVKRTAGPSSMMKKDGLTAGKTDTLIAAKRHRVQCEMSNGRPPM